MCLLSKIATSGMHFSTSFPSQAKNLTAAHLTMKVAKKRQLYGAAAIAAEKKQRRLLAEAEKLQQIQEDLPNEGIKQWDTLSPL